MNFLTDLPVTVEIAGKFYPIHTDFRDWIRFEMLLRDTDIPDVERAALMLDWFSDELPPPTPKIFDALFEFFLCGEQQKKSAKTAKPVFDYEQDMPLVYAGFIQGYSINLVNIEYLHWWEFRSLLDSIPEDTKIAKVIGYRATDIAKVPKSVRERYIELKRIFALKGTSKQKPATLEELNRELIERAKEARQRAAVDSLPALQDGAEDQ